MPWFHVDDNFSDHPKTRRAGNEAIGVWTRCGSWSSRVLTDGFVPEDIAAGYAGPGRAGRKSIESLVDAGLFEPAERDGERGYQLHDYTEWNPTADTVRERKRLAAERQRKHRAEHGSSPSTSRVTSHGTSQHPEGLAAAEDSSSAAAIPASRVTADDDLPMPLLILKSKCDAAKLYCRWDMLNADQAARIEHLITTRGDQALVQALANTWTGRLVGIQGAIGTWETVPERGRRLAEVRTMCPEHGHEYEPVPCKLCRAELVAGER